MCDACSMSRIKDLPVTLDVCQTCVSARPTERATDMVNTNDISELAR
jgi:hypothetical protein